MAVLLLRLSLCIAVVIQLTSSKSVFQGSAAIRQKRAGIDIHCTQSYWPKHEKCRKIQRDFDLTAVQGHPRSSILVSMESPYVTSY